MHSRDSVVPVGSVRPATIDDIPEMLEIEKVSYPKGGWTQVGFLAELEKTYSRVWVFTDDETDSIRLGYVVFWIVDQGCHILNITVHPEWRNLGLASRLLREVIREGLRHDCRRVFLEVRKSNAAALAMYQNHGFFVEHIHPKFYENGEDAYFMVLQLHQKNDF